MSINKSETQKYFEKMFTGSSGVPFRQIKKQQYEQTALTKQQAEDLRNLLEGEIVPYYYKALLSYMECIPALSKKLFSWATVRLYYSVFYAIKAYLACNNIAILRAERKVFYVKAKENELIKRFDDSTDHKGTILTMCKLFKNNDLLLSNSIEGVDAYRWMMDRREEVNYKDMDFHDPDTPDFWSELDNEISQKGIGYVVDKLVEDEWLLCFQNEYAILGVPTKRMILTVDAIHKLGKAFDIANEKQALIDSLSNELLQSSTGALVIWK